MTVFEGCSFMRADIDKPIVGANGNVCFPESWSFEQRRHWRILMEIPGAETWPEPTYTRGINMETSGWLVSPPKWSLRWWPYVFFDFIYQAPRRLRNLFMTTER